MIEPVAHGLVVWGMLSVALGVAFWEEPMQIKALGRHSFRVPRVSNLPRPTPGVSDRLTLAIAEFERPNITERPMSLLGKMKHLTETAQDFTKETEAVLDGIAAKIEAAKGKRDAAGQRHHAYYDEIIKGVDDSIEVIERLSNGPLEGGGTP